MARKPREESLCLYESFYTEASRIEIARLLNRDPKMVTHLEKQFNEKEWKELGTIKAR